MTQPMTLTERLLAIPVGEMHLIEHPNPETVRTIAWRLKTSEEGSYKLRWAPTGYHVERLA